MKKKRNNRMQAKAQGGGVSLPSASTPAPIALPPPPFQAESSWAAPRAPAVDMADWHKPAATYIALFGLVVALCGTGISAYFSYLGFAGLQEQIRLQQDIQRQSLPVDFRLIHQVSPSGDELLRIRNEGAAQLESIDARIRFFFAFPDGKVMTVAGIEKYLCEDTNALDKCQMANLVIKPQDVNNLIEPQRRFSVSHMSPRGAKDGSDEFLPEISPSSVLNALRLAQVLGARIVLRCRFEYQHQVTHQLFSHNFHILILPVADGDLLKVRPQEVLDLSKTLGGKAIVDELTKVEESSQEVTFSKP